MVPQPRLRLLTLCACTAGLALVVAQAAAPYTALRTEYGQPNFQGVWATEFVTPLERPAGISTLVANPEQAQALVATIRSQTPSVIDPDFQLQDIQQLAKVKGEYRTSLIVEPSDGRMPFTRHGLELAGAIARRNAQQFDDFTQRPLNERCLESLGYAPMRTLPVFVARHIIQTRDVVAILSEDAVGLRMIHLAGDPPPDAVRSIEGYSKGHWEGDTLVAKTTHLRADDPARRVQGRPLLFSGNSVITERFTRVSDRELFYQFTVDDEEIYTRPWSGEFSMIKQDHRIYEFACHEGNYSLMYSLSGGREAAKPTDAKPEDR